MKYKKVIIYLSLLLCLVIVYVNMDSHGNQKFEQNFTRNILEDSSNKYEVEGIKHVLFDYSNASLSIDENELVFYYYIDNKLVLSYYNTEDLENIANAEYELSNIQDVLIENFNKNIIYFSSNRKHFMLDRKSGKILMCGDYSVYRSVFVEDKLFYFLGQELVNESYITGFYGKNLDTIKPDLVFEIENAQNYVGQNVLKYDGMFVKQDDFLLYGYFHIAKLFLMNLKDNSFKIVDTGKFKEDIEVSRINDNSYFLQGSGLNNIGAFMFFEDVITVVSGHSGVSNGVVLDNYSISENKYLNSHLLNIPGVYNESIIKVFFKDHKVHLLTQNGIWIRLKYSNQG